MQLQPWRPADVARCAREHGHEPDPLTTRCRRCHGDLAEPAETPVDHRAGSNTAPCPIPGCAESVIYHGSSMVTVEPGGYAPDFGKYMHMFGHDGDEGHLLAVTTHEPPERVLDRLSGTLDDVATLMWGQS